MMATNPDGNPFGSLSNGFPLSVALGDPILELVKLRLLMMAYVIFSVFMSLLTYEFLGLWEKKKWQLSD